MSKIEAASLIENVITQENDHINFQLEGEAKMVVFGDPDYPTPEGATIRDLHPTDFFYGEKTVDSFNSIGVQSKLESVDGASPIPEPSNN